MKAEGPTMQHRHIFQKIFQEVLFQEHLQDGHTSVQLFRHALNFLSLSERVSKSIGGRSVRKVKRVLVRVYLSRQNEYKDATTMSLNVRGGHSKTSDKVAVLLRQQSAIGSR